MLGEIQHINIKLYPEIDGPVETRDAIGLFHRWIQEERLGELLIDVADYSHVPYGPGVMLIGHEANYSLEPGREDRLGLLYNAKAGQSGSNQERIIFALGRASQALALLAKEEVWEGRISPAYRQIKLMVNDRLLCPNSEASFLALRPAIESALASFLDHQSFQLNFQIEDPRRLFEVVIALEQEDQKERADDR